MSTVANTPAEAVAVAEAGLLKKATAPWASTMVAAMFAGALIGFGFIFYATTQMGASELPYGVAKAIGGLAFSGGLFVVIITGGDLFTSTTMSTLPLADGRLRWGRLLAHWGVVYVFNMVGAGILVMLVFYSGTALQHGGEWGAILVSAANAKVSHTWTEAFFLGVLCNLLVCLAVWVGFLGKTVVDRFIAVLFPISLFVAAGFEHSVANMFIIPMGLVLKAQGAPEVIEALGGKDVSGLTWTSYVFDNLVPVTLGNILAGAVFIALGMRVWHRHARTTGASPISPVPAPEPAATARA